MAYTYKIENNYRAGVPQTAFAGGAGPYRGISCHWTAGGKGRAGALGTVQFFIDLADRNASYHEIWWWENKTFGVMRVVPAANASHSMNPTPPTWNPNALVKRILGDKVGDPNRYSYSVSFAGMPADLTAAMQDPDFIAACARRTGELIRAFPSLSPAPLFNHADGQPATRTDWGTALRPAIYKVMGQVGGDDMPQLNFKVEEWWTREEPDTPFWMDGPEQGEKKWFLNKQKVVSIAESQDGLWRIVPAELTELADVVWVKRVDMAPVTPGGDDPYFVSVVSAMKRMVPTNPDQTAIIASLKTQVSALTLKVSQLTAKLAAAKSKAQEIIGL
jgi:hypothetical protein